MPAADNGANKLAALLDFAERGTYNQCVVFAASQERAALVLAALAARSFPAEALYSHAGANEVIEQLHRFRVGHMRWLVTDAGSAVRACEVMNATALVNYDLPASRDEYIARMGGGGAFGRRQYAVNLAAGDVDTALLAAIAHDISPPARVLRGNDDELCTLFTRYDDVR